MPLHCQEASLPDLPFYEMPLDGVAESFQQGIVEIDHEGKRLFHDAFAVDNDELELQRWKAGRGEGHGVHDGFELFGFHLSL